MGGRASPESIARFNAKRTNAMREAKKERGCAICGYNEDGDGLEFDHIEPERRARRNGTRGAGRAGRSARELERVLNDPNIQVLCGTCHNIKSNAERREWRTKRFDGAGEER
jgi:5-methylcytosine-specific restriction endonuclease McrA